MERLESAYPTGEGDRLPFEPEGVLDPAFLLPTAGVVASEVALYAGRVDVALWGHFLTLLVCVLGPLELDNGELLQAYALVPLFRLVNLGMPVFVELTLLWFPLVYAPIVPAMYLIARDGEVQPLDVRPRFSLLVLPVAILLSAVLAEIEYAIIRPTALVPSFGVADLLLVTVVMVCFVGFVEEFVYRGVLQRTLQRHLNRYAGLVVASALFGLMHSAYHEPAELLFASAIGLVFGLVYDATDSLTLVVVVHGSLNVFLFAIIPLQGSLFGIA